MSSVAAVQTPRTPSRANGARWLAVVSHTDPRYGGLSTAVPRLGLSLVRELPTGTRPEMSLAAFCSPEEQVRPEGYDDEHLSFWPISRRAWLGSSALRARLAGVVRQVDGMHLHGLWEASTTVASRAALAAGKPYVLSAHGMLEPWALATKRWKKRIYAALMERRTVAGAACLHALTTAEAEQYRNFGASNPIAIVPNAVHVPRQRSPELFLESFPELRGKRLFLFLGRLHPKKGLDLLADAWGALAEGHPEAHLVLAGPDSDGTEARLRSTFAAAGLMGRVTFTGMLDGASKWSALVAAECFLLPSFSEGLSMSVLEALGAGVPALITRACHMPEVTEARAGWEIEPEVGELREAMHGVLMRSPGENRATGDRGARLIASRYAPARIAREMAEVYAFALQGAVPKVTEIKLGLESGLERTQGRTR